MKCLICAAECIPPKSGGHPPRMCSAECRRAYTVQRRHLEANMARHEQWLANAAEMSATNPSYRRGVEFHEAKLAEARKALAEFLGEA